MSADSPDHWEHEKALYYTKEAMRVSSHQPLKAFKNRIETKSPIISPHGLEAAMLQVFGDKSMRNRTAALTDLEASMNYGLVAAFPLHHVIEHKLQNSDL